jgi:hypothetical protein
VNSIHRWVINSVDKDVLRNALMANGWHITNPFQGEEKTAVHIIAVYCGLVAQPPVCNVMYMQVANCHKSQGAVHSDNNFFKDTGRCEQIPKANLRHKRSLLIDSTILYQHSYM